MRIEPFTAPPHPPTVYDGKGKRMSDRLGPYKLGTKLTATCVSNGGTFGIFVSLVTICCERFASTSAKLVA